MAETSELKRLAERRRALVARSGELRAELAVQFLSLQTSTAWIQRGYTIVQSSRVVWPWVAGLLGLLVARHRGGWLSKARRVWTGWRIAKNIIGLRHGRREVTEAEPSTS